MKKHKIAKIVAGILLAGFFFLAKEETAVLKGEATEKIVVVDAGHGGMDPGVVATDGTEEKDINLSIAKKLKTQLEDLGMTVVLSREGDEGLNDLDAGNKKQQDMERRLELMNEKEVALTVSIHQNSYPDASVCGPQVFYYETSAEGKKLAELIQQELNEGLGAVRPREAKGDGNYYLLKYGTGLMVIVECGFLTNPEEALLLQQEDYQEQAAVCISSGIQKYFGEDVQTEEAEQEKEEEKKKEKQGK